MAPIGAPPPSPFEADPVGSRPRQRRLAPKVLIGGAIVCAFLLVAVLAPVLAPHDPYEQNLLDRLEPPSTAHWLGTDSLGRDVLSRMIHAARTDLWMAFLAALLPMLAGTALGSLAGYFGRLADTVVMRLADLVQAFPVYVLTIALVFVVAPVAGERIGVGPLDVDRRAAAILIAFTAVGWVVYARLVRSEILRVRELDYVKAARMGGLSNLRILLRHVLPNATSQTVVYFFADFGIAILVLAALSFLGLGFEPERPEWGSMIEAGRPFIRSNWWLSTVPGLVMATLGVGLALVGDGLDDRRRDS